MKIKTYILNLLILLVVVSGCRTTPKEEVVFIKVNSFKLACNDDGTHSCLQVKYKNDKNWRLLHNEIEGFNYKPGYIYELNVIKRPLKNKSPGKNNLSFSYHVKSVLNKTRDKSIHLNDIWGLTSIWMNKEEVKILNKRFTKGYPILELNTRKMLLSGHDGCNTINGSIDKVDNTTLIFENIITSLIHCNDIEISKQVSANLSRVNRYEFQGLQLSLYADHTPLLTYRKMD